MGYMDDGNVPSGFTPKGKEISWRVICAMYQVMEEEGHPWDVSFNRVQVWQLQKDTGGFNPRWGVYLWKDKIL